MYTLTHDGGHDGGSEPDRASHGGGLIALEDAQDRGSEHPPPPVAAALHLFLHAAFIQREPALLAPDERDVAAQFGVGAIVQASSLARLPDREARGLTRALLRWGFGVGHLRAWQWERTLRQQAQTRPGRIARHEGCASLLGWLQGEDPARRLDRLLARALPRPADRRSRPSSVRELAAHKH